MALTPSQTKAAGFTRGLADDSREGEGLVDDFVAMCFRDASVSRAMGAAQPTCSMQTLADV